MMINKAIQRPALRLLLILSVLMSSCASIKGTEQTLLVPTDVKSVDIYLADGSYVGKGPGFVNVPRKKHQSLRLVHEGKSKDLPLTSQYRWGDSFWPSLLGTVFIPLVGITSFITDYYTGAAWEYQPLKRINFERGFSLSNYQPEKIAITPAQYKSEIISDEVSSELVQFIKARYPKASVLGYEAYQPVYSEWGWTHESYPGRSNREKLYQELNSDHVLNTQMVKTNGRYLIRAQLYDLHRNEVRDKFVIEKKVRRQNTSKLITDGARSFFYELVPNSLGIENLKYGEEVLAEVDNGRVETKTDRSGMFGTQLGLTIANLRAPQVSGMLDPYFEWRSKASVFYRSLEFIVSQDQPVLYDYAPIKVRWYGGLIGLGPEVGLDTPIGLFYVQAIPAIGYNYVLADEGKFKDQGEFRISAYLEMGYGIYISDRLYLQIYAASHSRPHLFKDVIKASYDSVDYGGDQSMAISGISLSYFFPEGRSRMKKIIRDF